MKKSRILSLFLALALSLGIFGYAGDVYAKELFGSCPVCGYDGEDLSDWEYYYTDDWDENYDQDVVWMDEENFDYGDFEPIDPEKSSDRIKKVEEFLSKLLPADRMDRITNIYEDSDGYDGVTAYVDSSDGKKWDLAIDPADVDIENNIKNRGEYSALATLIHEYAHIESLNNTQVKYDDHTPKKGELLLEEGSAKKDAYITEFAKKFWSKDMMKEAKNGSLIADKDSFVTEYAASNAVEDFAESFARFVLDEKKKGNKLVDKKINFFYNYPELVKLREHMNKAIEKL